MALDLETLEAAIIVLSASGLVVLGLRAWRGRRPFERAAIALLILAGLSALVWKGATLLGMDEDEFPAIEAAETLFFVLLAGMVFLWVSSLLSRRADALRDARDELHHVAAHRQMLLDVLSHDLRNPLTAALLQLEPANVRVKTSLLRMSRLIDDTLLLSRIESARGFPIQPLDAAALAQQAVEGLRPLAGMRRVEIALDAPPSLSFVGNGLFRNAVENLAANAIKWSPEGGKVVVRLRAERDAVIVEVADRGPGVPAQVRASLFRRFERGDPQDVAGTGLGLAIVRRVAEAHGGGVQVDDTPGGGATFTMSVPRGAEPLQRTLIPRVVAPGS